MTLLEAAPQGSSDLDRAIAAALDVSDGRYSQSLDAALRLVPPGWSLAQLSQRIDSRGQASGWTADLYRPDLAVLSDAPPRVMPSAPLALAIAALRVRVQGRAARAA